MPISIFRAEIETRMHAASTFMSAGPTLEPVRFGEFLRDRNLISDEQWIAALARHWSSPQRTRIGDTLVDCGILSIEIVEAEARVFHDDLDIIEVTPRSEKTTLQSMPIAHA